MVRVVGTLARRFFEPERDLGDDVPQDAAGWAPAIEALQELLRDLTLPEKPGPRVWGVSLNRRATGSIDRSALAIKAAAARRLFNIRCDRLTWAIVDSGIDAEHPAFRLDVDGKRAPKAFALKDHKPSSYTRVVATFDFSRVRDFLDADLLTDDASDKKRAKELACVPPDDLRRLRDDLVNGRNVDWSLLAPLLKVPQD